MDAPPSAPAGVFVTWYLSVGASLAGGNSRTDRALLTGIAQCKHCPLGN